MKAKYDHDDHGWDEYLEPCVCGASPYIVVFSDDTCTGYCGKCKRRIEPHENGGFRAMVSWNEAMKREAASLRSM